MKAEKIPIDRASHRICRSRPRLRQNSDETRSIKSHRGGAESGYREPASKTKATALTF